MNQGEAWLRSHPQLLLICGVLPRRWGRDEEGRAQAGLAPSKRGAFCPLLLQTIGLPPSGNRKLKVKSLSRV